MCNRTKYFAHVCFIGSSIEAVDLIFLSIFPNSRPNSPVTFFMPDAGFWDYSIVFFLPKPFLDIIFSLTLFFYAMAASASALYGFPPIFRFITLTEGFLLYF